MKLSRIIVGLFLLSLIVGVAQSNPNDYNGSVVRLLHFNGTSQSTTFVDSSSYGATITPYGNATINTTTYKLGGASGRFDGINSSVFMQNSDEIAFNKQNTISFWIYPVASTGVRYIVVKATNGGRTPFGLYQSGTEYYLNSASAGSSSNDIADGLPVGNVINNQWSELSFSKNATHWSIYENNTPTATIATTADLYVTSGPLVIGDYTGFGYPFSGYIDSFKFWNGVAIPISELYPQTYEVGVPPVASFTQNTTGGVGSITVLFTNTSTNYPQKFNWTFQDVTGNNTIVGFSTSAIPFSHTFGTGNYSINLNATNPAGSNVSFQNAWVNVSVPIPLVMFTTNVSTGVTPLVLELNDTSARSPTMWNTSWGDGTFTNQTTFPPTNITHTYTDVGSFYINQYATNAYGTANGTPLLITVLTPMVANFTGVPTNGGIPLSVTFTDTSVGSPTSWSWDFGDGNSSTLQNPSHTYVTSGTYTVALTATNIYNFDTETKVNYITATDAPTANFNVNKSYGIPPLAVAFTDTSIGSGITWSWDFGDGNTSILQNPTHTFVSDGNYNVNLTVTNGFGSSSKIKVILVAGLSSAYTGVPTAGAYPLSVLFTETTTGLNPDSFYWEFGDGNTSTSQNPTHTFPHMGYYTINNRITNGSYVFWNNKTNYIEAYGITPSFSVSNTTSSTSAPLVVAFTSTSTTLNATVDTYLWVFGDGTQSTDATPVHVYDTTFGTFQSNLTLGDSAKGISYTSATTTLYRIPTNTVSNISRNIVMNQVFPTTIMVKDSFTYALIGGVKVTDNSGNTYVLDNGILSEFYEYGPHTFTFEADGYSTKTTSLFVVGNSTFTVYMDATTGSTFNIYSQKQVGISVVRYNPAGQKVIGAPISLSAISSTLQSDAQLQTLYGLNPTAANQMMNGTLLMNGVTGGDGASAFTVLSSIRYQVNVTDPIDSKIYTTTINPAQDPYTIWIGTNPLTSQNNSVSVLNNTALYMTQPNASYVTLNLRYQDLSGSTSNLKFYVMTTGNRTIIYTQDLGNPGTSVVYANHTHKNIRGIGYYWYYNATRSEI